MASSAGERESHGLSVPSIYAAGTTELSVNESIAAPPKAPNQSFSAAQTPFLIALAWWRRWKPAILISLLNIFYGVASVVLVPVLPGIKRRYFGSDQQAAFVQTLMQGISSAIALCLAPLWGQLLDTVGRRPFFVFVGLFNMLPIAALFLNLDNPMPMMILQAVAALVTSGHTNAYLADWYTPRLRTTAIAMSFASSQLTSLSATLIFGVSDNTLVIIALVMQSCGAAIMLLFIHESLPAGRRKTFSIAALENPFAAMKHVFTSKVVIGAVAMYGVFTVSMTGLGEVYLYYLNQRVGFHKDDNAVAYLEAGLLNPLFYAVLLPFLTRVVKLRQVTAVAVSLASLCAEMICLCLLFFKWEIWAIGVPLSALSNMGTPAIVAIIANAGDSREQGKRMAGFTALTDAFATLAPLIFGQTYAHLSGNWVMLPFVLGAIATLPAAFLLWKLRQWIIKGEDGALDDDAPTNEEAEADSTREQGVALLV